MSNKLKDYFYKALIWCFFILWILVAIISIYHTWIFFIVGNPSWLAGIMSVAFETGLALTLFSILTTDNHKNMVPWILMVLLTIVQICGNVFSVYKYMIEAHTADTAYRYINGSFLHWFVYGLQKPDILSIISIMLGAILPVVALFMTDMVANNFKMHMLEKENIINEKEKYRNKNQMNTETPKSDTEEKQKKPDISEQNISGQRITESTVSENNQAVTHSSNDDNDASPKILVPDSSGGENGTVKTIDEILRKENMEKHEQSEEKQKKPDNVQNPLFKSYQTNDKQSVIS